MKVDDTSTRKRIIDSAIHLFSQHGFNGAAISDIAESAGVTKPSIYYYFKSKSLLFETIIIEGVEEIFQIFRDNAESDQNCYESLLAVFTGVFEHARNNSELVWIIFTHFLSKERCERPIPVSMDKKMKNFEQMQIIITKGIDSGEIINFGSTELTRAIHGQLIFAIMSFLAKPDFPLNKETAKKIINIFFSGAASDRDKFLNEKKK